ncbi:MAG: hypothetical protein WKF59_19730 [Chitinophagaceae bacterium]
MTVQVIIMQHPGSEIEITDGKWLPAKTTLNQQKTYKELRDDEPFVSSFYFESDPFYQYIFGEHTRAVPIFRTERMFLIVVANTNDPTVGASAQKDVKNVSQLFTSLAQNLGITKIFPLYIFGNEYSKLAAEASLAVLEKQKPSSKDIVVFTTAVTVSGYRATKAFTPACLFARQ